MKIGDKVKIVDDGQRFVTYGGEVDKDNYEGASGVIKAIYEDYKILVDIGEETIVIGKEGVKVI